MHLAQGRIGKQESMGLTALAVVMSVVFTLDEMSAYTNGNATYIALPAAVLLSLVLFLLVHRAMAKMQASSFFDLCERTFGTFGKYISGILIIAFYVFAAWAMLERFTTVIHSVIFITSHYSPILMWVIVAVAFFAMQGLECISRTAKILALFIGIVVLVQLAVAMDGYRLYRLAPFPADQVGGIALLSLKSMTFAFPPLLALLCAAPALQGMKNVRQAGVRGAMAAVVMVALIQLCVGMAFTYKELENLTIPLFRIDMILSIETDAYRADLLSVLILLIGAIVSAAYFIFSASAIFTKVFTVYDVRPAAASISATIASLLLFEHLQDNWGVHAVVAGIKNYAWIALAPFALLAVIALIKAKRKGGSVHEAA